MADVSTNMRIQPLAASTAMLAQEHARLDRAKSKLEKEIAEMQTTQTPTGDDLVRALANEIAAEEAKTAAKRAALARAEEALGTRQRDEAARQAREDAEARAALVDRMNDAAEAYFDGIQQAEAHLAAFVASANAAISAHTELRRIAHTISAGGKVPLSLSPAEMVNRLGGRIGSALRKVRLPDRANTPQIGPLRLPEEVAPVRVPQPGEVPPVLGWRDREEAVLGGAVTDLLDRGGR